LAYRRLQQLAGHPDQLHAVKDIQLPAPVFDISATRIVTASSHASTSGTRERYAALEGIALQTWDRKGKKPMSLLPDNTRVTASIEGEWTKCLESTLNSSSHIDTFQVELTAVNPLNTPLILTNLTLSTGESESLDIETIPEVINLKPYETRKILIHITAHRPGTIEITSVSFLFHRFLPCTQSLIKKGKRLHATKAQRIGASYRRDTSLTVDVGIEGVRMDVRLEGIPEDLYEGEAVEGVLLVKNTGKRAIEGIQLLISEVGMIRLKPPGVYRSENSSSRSDHTKRYIPDR
jgi:hypothetical protein